MMKCFVYNSLAHFVFRGFIIRTPPKEPQSQIRVFVGEWENVNFTEVYKLILKSLQTGMDINKKVKALW